MQQWSENQKRANYRAGLTPAIVVNALSSKGAARAEPLDFFYKSEIIEPTPDDAAAGFALFADLLNKKFESKESGVRSQG